MSHAAQCTLCKHARWRGNRVIECLRFDHDGATDAELVLAALLFQIAATKPCVAMEKLQFGPDAYFAQDAPARD